MNSFSIAFNNFKRNIKVYSLYIMSMIFSVLVFYNFVELKYNPDFKKAREATHYINDTSAAVSFLLLLFIIFFIWFASSFFLSQRKKEIGIYAFMGVTNSQIALIYAIELIFIGMTSIAAGLILGVIFCKLFLMMLAKVAILNMKINFFMSVDALIETALVFFIIFFINAVLGYINICRSKLIDLMNAAKKEERLPKVNYLKGILSIICILIGYHFARQATGDKFTTDLPIAIIFVVIGTYWFFGAFYSIIMKFIISRKKILYNGVNIVSMTNIAFRIKNNYRTLAVVAILAAITLTSYGTVASLKYFIEIRDYIQSPYTISYISPDSNVKQQVINKINEHKRKINFEEDTEILLIKPHLYLNSKLPDDDETVAIKYSDFIKISSDLNAKDLSSLKKEEPSRGETIYIQTPIVVMSIFNYKNVKVSLNNKKYIIKDTFKTPLFGNGVPLSCMVMNDKDYELIKQDSQAYKFCGIKLSGTGNMKALKEELRSISSIEKTVFVSMGTSSTNYSIFGIIYFLGAFLALVFIIATGSIIYFKLVSEAYIDKDKYILLQRVGMTEQETFRAIAKQIAISYVLPLIVGIVHSCVAMSVLSELMNYNIMVPAVKSILIFIAVYAVYFIATTRKYMKIVM